LERDLPVLFSPLHAGASGRGLGVGVRTREERRAAAPPGGCAGAGDRGQARAVQQAAGGGPMGGYPRLAWATYRRKGATKD